MLSTSSIQLSLKQISVQIVGQINTGIRRTEIESVVPSIEYQLELVNTKYNVLGV